LVIFLSKFSSLWSRFDDQISKALLRSGVQIIGLDIGLCICGIRWVVRRSMSNGPMCNVLVLALANVYCFNKSTDDQVRAVVVDCSRSIGKLA